MSHTMKKVLSVLGFTLVLDLVCLSSAIQAEPPSGNWPQFRGPWQSGGLLDGGILGHERLGLEMAWKRPLGAGYSSISVVGGLGVTMFTDGKDDLLIAFAVDTGKERWRYRISTMHKGHTGSADGPLSTPVIEDGVIYGLGPHGHLFAIQLEDGEEIWSQSLDGESDSSKPYYGFATSPVVVGGLLVVQTGGLEGHSITAFGRENGEPRWATGDDPVTYQSPAVIEFDGHRQVVAVNDRFLMGIDPVRGKVLWKIEHGTDITEAFSLPLDLGDGKLLVGSMNEVVAFQVTSVDGRFSSHEAWRSNALQHSYTIPVLYHGYLFGFRGRFLTCIDASSGEVKWRSRPPGGTGLILVDGKLVILSSDGHMVIAEAASDGYKEIARLPTFDRPSHTAPSYANGYIFVRNLEEMAAVRVTETPNTIRVQAREPPPRVLLGKFGELIRQVEASGDTARLTDYLHGFDRFPIVEKGGIVHFVYQGEVEEVAISGNFLPFRAEVLLDRVTGADVYFKSMRFDLDTVWEYRYSINFGDRITDPANPLLIGSFLGPMSELRMPDFSAPDFLDKPNGPRGRVDSFQFRSDIRGNERRIWIYVPAGYAKRNTDNYPLILVNLGGQALNAGKLDIVLDNLIANKRMTPVIAVFVAQDRREYETEATPDFVRMLTEELIPHVDKHYRTVADPASRGIMGALRGGAMSIYAALSSPGSFGKVVSQSLSAQPPFFGDLLSLIKQSELHSLGGVVEWRRNDLFIEGLVDAAGNSRELANALQAKGLNIRAREVAGACGWSSFRAEIGYILSDLYPFQE